MSYQNLIAFALGTALLGGCGWFGKDEPSPLQIQNVGPSIKEVLKPLPRNLVGDTDNKLYGFDELRPPPTDEDGAL